MLGKLKLPGGGGKKGGEQFDSLEAAVLGWVGECLVSM